MSSNPVSLNIGTIIEEAHHLAGCHIQKHIGKNLSDFVWIRPEMTSPSFDDMNFRYKNQMFSILIRIYHNGKELTDPHRLHPLLEEAKNNNLIPCIFPVTLEFVAQDSSHGFGVVIEPGKNINHKLIVQDSTGWNLIHAKTNEKVDPLQIANDTPILMSNYELQNFAIQIVRTQLTKEGFIIESFCDVPGIFPHIFFRDQTGKFSWVYVKYGQDKKNIVAPVVSEIVRGDLMKYDGYFAPVGIKPMKGDKSYRGIGYYVDYSGLINIYKAN